jgi:uncharacterized phage protein (TIGR01671 family)
MKREIKFRAWNGEFMHYPMAESYVVRFDGVVRKFNAITQKYTTQEWELMQYTGLKDKYGKEVYEGDIVKTPLNNICEIKWAEVIEEWRGDIFKYTGFGLRNIKYNKMYHLDDVESFEIIGNIYANPELLK